MFLTVSTARLALVTMLVLGCISPAWGFHSLIERSPFKSTGATEVMPDRVTVDLKGLEEVVEFVGSYQLGVERRFSLNFREVNQKKWMLKDDALYGVKLIDYYEDEQVLVVDYQGKQGRLKLRQKATLAQKQVMPRLNASSVSPNMPQIRRSPAFGPPSGSQAAPPSVMPKRVPRPENLPPPPKRIRKPNSEVSA
ncbi:MAG: hypothetical protein JW706_02200 [Opitutales bacterium]|nr:hypothetical protein [Opitutales bacterium]